MNTGCKLETIKELCGMGLDTHQIQDEMLAAIKKVAIDPPLSAPAPLNGLGHMISRDALERHFAQPSTDELVTYLVYGKIPAIKQYKQRTVAGLKESKDAIENAVERLGLLRPEEKSHDARECDRLKKIIVGLVDRDDRIGGVYPLNSAHADALRDGREVAQACEDIGIPL